MVTLAELTNYTRTIPDSRRRITLDQKLDVAFYSALKPCYHPVDFNAGDKVQQLIKLGVPLRAKAHGENVAKPVGGSPTYKMLEIDLKELIDVCTLTKQAIDRATGWEGSWGRIVEESLEDMQQISFMEMLRFCSIGTGTGRVAKVASAAVASDGSANTWVKVFCDNTYDTFGWDNTQMIQEGMILELSQTGAAVVANTSSYSADATNLYPVIDVYFADRLNGAAATGGAGGNGILTTYGGYFIIDCFTTAAATEAAAAWNNDGYFVYRYGATKDIGEIGTYPLPHGLFYFLQDGVLLTEQLETDYFNLTRSAYKSLQANIVQGATPGTPEEWDLSTLTDLVMTVKKGPGKGNITHWLCNDKMGRAIGRQNTAAHNMVVQTNSTSAYESQAAALPQPPPYVIYNGKRIDVIIDEVIPNNSVIMIDSSDLVVHQANGGFDFLRLYGDIWGPTKNDAYTNYEALYGGYTQNSAEKTCNMVLRQDLLDNI